MTTKLEQAARQALEALEELHYSSGTVVAARKYEIATAALREALVQPTVEDSSIAQEPVAWARTSESGEVLDCISHTYKVTQHCTVDYDEPLYTAPVRTKDLTDDEIAQAVGSPLDEVYLADFRAVIAADREKNR